MTQRSRTYLKGISETGDSANQTLFEDLIDSAQNVTDDGISNEAPSLNVRADKKRFPTTKVTQSGVLTFTSVSAGAINGNGEVKVITCDGSDINLSGDFTNYSTIETTAGQTTVLVFVWNSSLNEYMVEVMPPTATVDSTAPTVTSATFGDNNDYIDVLFSEGVYGSNDGATAAALADFTLTFAANGGTATAWTASSAKQNDSTTEGSASALAGGETTIRIFGAKTGDADGNETVTVEPTDGASLYDAAGNSMLATQTAVATMTIIVMQDDFAGTEIDTGKFTVTNPDSTDLLISQNGDLRFTILDNVGSVAALTNTIDTSGKYEITDGAVQIDLNGVFAGVSINCTFLIGLYVDADNHALIIRQSGTNNARCLIYQAGSSVYDTGDSGVDVSQTFKITSNSDNEIQFWYLSAPDTWTQIGATQTYNLGTNKYLLISASVSDGLDAVSDYWSFDNLYITNANYSTSTPI
jgi:hypothetical protein